VWWMVDLRRLSWEIERPVADMSKLLRAIRGIGVRKNQVVLKRIRKCRNFVVGVGVGDGWE